MEETPVEGKVNQEKKKHWSLSAKLRMVVFLIIFIIITAFLISMFYFSLRERIDNAEREADSLLNTISNSIVSDVDGYKELSRLIMMDSTVVTLLRSSTKNVTDKMKNQARNGIFNILNVTEDVHAVFVFREDGDYVSTNRNAYYFDVERMEVGKWKADILASMGRAVISINSNNTIFKTRGGSVLTIGRAIYDIYTQERTGMLLMNVSDAVLEKEIHATKNDNVCIMDLKGSYLAGDENLVKYYSVDFANPKVIHKEVRATTGRRLISGCRIPEMPLIIITSANLNSGRIPYETGYILIFLLITVIIAAFSAGTFITRNITTPVFELTRAMEKNREEGKLERVNVVSVDNEIGMLEEGYNNMIDHVNDLIKRLIENEKILQKSEMRVLHEQIKPHFLYNSLETIGFLAMDAGAEEVHTALETLGSFYRNFLSKGDREIPLKREICIVQDYLSLQKLRYGDILQDEYDIAKDTENFVIPKLILQPLVENSIYHGIRLKGEEGVIKITSWMEEGVLHISVRDSGVGMTQEQIEQVLRKRNESEMEISSDPSESFGLWGTIERIRCFCDEDDVVKIRSEEGEYTEVEFVIPPRRMERDNGNDEKVQSDAH